MKKRVICLFLILIFALVGCSSNSDKIEELNKILEDRNNQIADLKSEIKVNNDRVKELENFLKLRTQENEKLSKENSELRSSSGTNNFYCSYYEKHFEPTISSEEAESIIKTKASQVIKLLKEKDMKELAKYIHPTFGVRFTPYTTVSLETDLVFNKENMENFFTDEKEYLWGYYDGSGFDILLKPSEYYDEFIYDENYVNTEKIGYNEVLSSNNNLENQFAFYHNSIVVEYYFSGFNPDYMGMDWRSLRLVFQKYEDKWYLVGIIHNQWTI